MLARTGLRNTKATREVVALFSGARTQLLSHAEVGALLHRKKVVVDKVTLYRVLDRLAKAGVLHKVVEQDRITRFGWNTYQASDPFFHPRFECQECHRSYQLAHLPTEVAMGLRQALAAWGVLGYRSSEAEIAVRGFCFQCTPH